MNPFSDLAPLPRQLHVPCVRDLAWALTSPPLLAQAPAAQRHPLAGSEWAADPDRLAAWLRMQDTEPERLQAFLAQGPVRRLGMYYEQLWRYALAAAPGVTVLAAGLAVREAGRTLGEFDLLLADATGIHHLELAVKFYLGPPEGGGQAAAQWLGPGCHDRLDKKLAHLAERQLRLGQAPAGRAALARAGAALARPAMWLGGYLFSPWPQGCATLSDAHPQHLRGQWLPASAWPAYAATQPSARWSPLPRARWLAPANGLEPLDARGVAQWLQGDEPMMQARMLAKIDEGGSEVARLMVVPQAWPQLPKRY
ncbi:MULTISPECIES: DUF1853 family protein [unclassified Pseudomonas]|uniref:DUF1853 family protein n=1 Tax=unclassified Pseudomonas TaxID=196821 RepID=UPI000BD4C476|nr:MULTISPECIES: DUF1853 family protein [unclassified Pseudomonas]PVZ13657.1 hypothetical protein F474_02739 [Pseudomonas sp. URIL14HWK12:I12]PVZ23963.1 hypothetical protein F470_02394 [Pseudomonas sp. URIL14HWK12:I10]PVZ33398.1 hypothetical protein F472_02868 [Pseudomonas sp. URIL14HWK12:I11]SNZ11422.1 hypothetical protein SAMN05660463_01853 [Pseudomonas sp. URIL14HWK12:I9]